MDGGREDPGSVLFHLGAPKAKMCLFLLSLSRQSLSTYPCFPKANNFLSLPKSPQTCPNVPCYNSFSSVYEWDREREKRWENRDRDEKMRQNEDEKRAMQLRDACWDAEKLVGVCLRSAERQREAGEKRWGYQNNISAFWMPLCKTEHANSNRAVTGGHQVE